MKIKLPANVDAKRIGGWIVGGAKYFWKVLSRRFWMKLLSLLLAILLWNYVVSSDTSLTRTKTITGVNGYISGQSTLTTYGLALLSDPAEQLEDITVRMEVAQSNYSRASADNVQVVADLSSVRRSGTQEVPLKATSSYGRVTDILPETVSLTFEPLDSRLIPVNVGLTGEKNEDNWYNIARTNPSAVTVSGAASVVRSISQARVYSDVTGAEESYVRAEPYVLLDGDGNEIAQDQLTRSASSITVTTDVYPTRDIPISTEIEEVVRGRVAEGYTISEITIQPEFVTVAADESLLNGISELLIEPVNVEGQSQSMSARARVSKLTDFKNMSTEQVYVNITIVEEDVSEWINNTALTFVGKAENLQLEWQKSDIQVYVTGPKSVIETLKEDGIPITVNLTGFTAGEYSCPLRFPTENYPEVSFEPEISAIAVKLTENPEE
ncbi:MAG: hypothetical protein J6M10_08925 [Clostridia bacterium]|nr:hypothetical protein [Clostridia bacterium]